MVVEGGNIGFWDRVNEALKTGIPIYGLINPPSSEIYKQAETDITQTYKNISEAVSDLIPTVKESVVEFFDTVGQSAGALTQSLTNQVLLIMGVAIVGLYFLSKSKIKLGA